VQELSCTAPANIDNGAYHFLDGANDTYIPYGTRVQYYCGRGYLAVGNTIRTCELPDDGWTGDLPSCEPEHLAAIRNQLSTLENKVSRVLGETSGLANMGDKFSLLESRVTKLESGTDLVPYKGSDLGNVETELHRIRTAINSNNKMRQWESLTHQRTAQIGVKEDHIVSEFSFVIKNFADKIRQHRSGNFPYVESPPFYTNIPGYRMMLHIFPDYDETGYIGFYSVLVPGIYDDAVPWPFSSTFELSAVSTNDEEEDARDTLVPARVPGCNFGRPKANNTIGCGFHKFLSHELLKQKADNFKHDGDMLFKIIIYLNYS
jgi:hypothetical protein